MLARHAAAIAAAPALRWIGYLSTTGVYGDRGGAWVDEASAPAPSSERGHRRVAAEQAWLRPRPGAAVDLFRLAGIYGPAAPCWTMCGPAGRAGWTSPATCSAASTATTSPARCWPPSARTVRPAPAC